MRRRKPDRDGGTGAAGVLRAGSEVSCRPIGFCFREFEKQGHPTDSLLEGIEHSRETLCARNGRVDWASFRQLLINVGRVWDDDELIEAGRRMCTSRWVQPFGAAARLIHSCDDLYRWNFKPETGISHQLFTCIENQLNEEGPNRIAIDTRMAPGYEVSRELFMMFKGSLSAMPRLLALQDAEVEMTLLDQGVRYRVEYPPDVGVVAAIRRTLSRPFAARTAANELREAHEQLFQQTGRLESESTIRASIERALRESESRFRKAFDGAPTLMVITTADGELLDVNDAFVLAVGMRREEVIGHRTSEFELWVDPLARGRLAEQALNGDPVRVVEAEFRDRFGERRVGLVSAEQIAIDREICLIWQVLDITERKRAEEENRRLQERILHAQKLESLGVMAGGIAHDFNNILVGILGNADLALGEIDSATDDARRRLQSIRSASQRAADLTRQMLAYAGKASIVRAPFDLRQLVMQTTDLVRSGLSKRVVLVCDSGAGPVCVV